MKKTFFIVAVWCSSLIAHAVEKAPTKHDPIQPPTPQWKTTIEGLAPAKPTIKPRALRRVLVFSLSTGYYHEVIPHTAAVIEILGKKSGAFQTVHNNDIEVFAPKTLQEFDAVVLNNTCSVGSRRNLFLDVLGNEATFDKNLGLKYKYLTTEQRSQRAAELENSLLDYVASGKGLVCMHGAMTMLNNSAEFSEMIGGSFDFHPRRQEITLKLVDPDHPLLAAFHGESFVHNDEPYLFNKAYRKKNFYPLLEMDVSKLDKKTRADPRVTSDVRYVAWIKPYSKGRVFYCGPSHQPESFETQSMLRFLLDGIQYALGDLQSDAEAAALSQRVHTTHANEDRTPKQSNGENSP